MGTYMIWGVPIGFKGQYNCSTFLLIVFKPWNIADVVFRRSLLFKKYFDLVSITLPSIVLIQGGKDVTPLLMGQGAIVLILYFHIIMYGLRETFLSCYKVIVLRELTVAEFPLLPVKNMSNLLSQIKVSD